LGIGDKTLEFGMQNRVLYVHIISNSDLQSMFWMKYTPIYLCWFWNKKLALSQYMCIGANACKTLHNKLIVFNSSNNMIDPIDYI
jgi:hypothetical protein